MSLCNGLFALVVCSKKLLGLPAVASSSVLHVLEECELVDTGEDVVNASADGAVFVCRIANIMAMVVAVIVRFLLLSLLFGRHLFRQEHLLMLSFFMVIIFIIFLH